MNIKSKTQLIDYITSEKSWRSKELINFKGECLIAKGMIQNSFFKTGICLIYSHWEGFVKNSGLAFFTFLNKSGFKYTELQSHYKVCAYLEHFQGQYPHKNFQSHLAIARDEINFNKSLKIDPIKFIDTKSNLNFETLSDILEKIGLQKSLFELKANFIDESLINMRNAIAHGEFRSVSQRDFLNIYHETEVLMNTFFNEIINFIIQENFKK